MALEMELDRVEPFTVEQIQKNGIKRTARRMLAIGRIGSAVNF